MFVITLTFCKATTTKKQIKEFELITDNFVIKEITSGFWDFSESHLIKVLSAFSLLRAGGSFGQQCSGFRSSVRPVLINTNSDPNESDEDTHGIETQVIDLRVCRLNPCAPVNLS